MNYKAKLQVLGALSDTAIAELRTELSAAIDGMTSQPLRMSDIAELAFARNGLKAVDNEIASRAELAATKATELADTPVESETPVEQPAEKKIETFNIVKAETLQSDTTGAMIQQGASMVASADLPGITAGSRFNSLTDVAEAFIQKHRVYRGVAENANGDRAIVASIQGVYPQSRYLGNNADANMRTINDVVSTEALVASGGFCAPVTPYYQLPVLAEAVRPVRDALAAFQADRGGIRFMPTPKLSSTSGAITTVTGAEDAGDPLANPVVPPKNKACLHITCDAEQVVHTTAISRCLKFGNFGSRTFPEQVEAWLKLTTAMHARTAEQLLLDGISSGSTDVTLAATYGATRTVLPAIDQLIAAYNSRNRIVSGINLRIMLPMWVKNLIRADLTRSYEPMFNVSDAQITEWFTVRGVQPTWYVDSQTGAGQVFGAQNAGAATSFPTTIKAYMFREGDFLFLDGGTLDLGIVRDSVLNTTNDYSIFAESFEGVAFVGVEAIKATITVTPNGAYPTGSTPV